MKKSNLDINPLQLLLVFFGVLILGMIFRRVAFLFLMVLMVVMLIGSIYYLVKYYQEGKKEEAYKKTMEGSIAQNLKLCEEQIAKNEKEQIDIQQNIIDLKERMDDKMNINENSIRESEFLISGFERELDLRKAKLDFYNICKEKLQTIFYNQKLAEEIALKKEKLKQLQEDHFDDLAEMEQLKSDMDYTKSYIETINNLSLRMAESTSLSTAQELHNELKLITKELRDL